MINKFRYRVKHQSYLVPLCGGFLGFLIGISGISNHLIFANSERILKNKLVNTPQEFTTLSFTGLRTLFLTYVGMSAGLALSKEYSSRNRPEQKK